MNAVGDSDPEVRRAAMKGLRNVAGPAQVDALLNLLLSVRRGPA